MQLIVTPSSRTAGAGQLRCSLLAFGTSTSRTSARPGAICPLSSKNTLKYRGRSAFPN